MTTTNTTTIPMPPIGAIRAIMRLRKRSPEIDQRVLGAIVLAANYMPDGDWSGERGDRAVDLLVLAAKEIVASPTDAEGRRNFTVADWSEDALLGFCKAFEVVAAGGAQ